MVDTVITFNYDGRECRETITFGSETKRLLDDILITPLGFQIRQNRTVEEWYEYWYGKAIKFYWDYIFELGFIPRTVEPRRKVPPEDVCYVTFPDGWILYREAKDA